MISKEDFVEVIELIKKQDKYNDAFTKVVKIVSTLTDVDIQLDKYSRMANDFLLVGIFGEDALDSIYDWIYLHDETKKIKTIEKLYDYICKAKNEKSS